MTRKTKLSRLERDILGQLSDAGAEDSTVIMNSLSTDVGHPPRESIFTEFQSAVRRMLNSELVEFVYSDLPGYPPVEPETVRRLLDMASWIRWEPNGRYWTAVP